MVKLGDRAADNCENRSKLQLWNEREHEGKKARSTTAASKSSECIIIAGENSAALIADDNNLHQGNISKGDNLSSYAEVSNSSVHLRQSSSSPDSYCSQ